MHPEGPRRSVVESGLLFDAVWYRWVEWVGSTRGSGCGMDHSYGRQLGLEFEWGVGSWSDGNDGACVGRRIGGEHSEYSEYARVCKCRQVCIVVMREAYSF